MKYILGIMFAVLGLVSCNDFLEESSQDEVRPSTVEDLMQLMVGEGYPMLGVLDCFLDLLTDDVECLGSNGMEVSLLAVRNARPIYTWSQDMFEEMAGAAPISGGINVWETYYKKIMGCNVVLDNIDKVSGNVANKENLRGQALAMRSYYYFILVNLFGQPYNAPGQNPEVSLGVPLKLTMDVTDEFFRRNTVAEVYEQVIDDLIRANTLLEQYNLEMPVYKMSHIAAKAILSRVYLYMENWDESLKYSNQVLELKPEITSLSGFATLPGSSDGHAPLGFQSPYGVYNPTVSREMIWAYGSKEEYSLMPSGAGSFPPYRASTDLMGLYDYEAKMNVNDHLGDLRGRLYFYNNPVFDMSTFQVVLIPGYGSRSGFDLNYCNKGIRTAEIYLNRAEVYIRKFIETGSDEYRVKALADLNLLREHRYDTREDVYVTVNKQSAEDLLAFYQDERRRELSFENHRWFDLRRYGMPRIEHTYFEDANSVPQVVALEERSNRYVLPIPQVVLQQNPLLVQNP